MLVNTIHWVRKNVLQMSEEEIRDMDKQIKEEMMKMLRR